MRVHVALGPAEFPGTALDGRAALVVDVLRATTSVVAACAAGCRTVIPVPDEAAARRAASRFPPGECLLAGERDGDPIEGFRLRQFSPRVHPERVAGRAIVSPPRTGPRHADRGRRRRRRGGRAHQCRRGGALGARVRRDLTVLCSGEKGAFCLEDAVCAGFVVEALARDGARDLRPTECRPRRAAPRRSPTRHWSWWRARGRPRSRLCALCKGARSAASPRALERRPA